MRARLTALLGAAIIVASCGSPNVTPSGSPASPTPPATQGGISTPATTPSPGATSAATPTASPQAATGRWQPAGSMALGRASLHAVVLGDGSVLVIGNDGGSGDCVRPDSARSETWDPVSGTWAAGPSLNAARAEFAAVPVAGGGVLVTGGVTAGVVNENGDTENHQSYSSTYAYEPGADPPKWSRKGLLDRARTLPTAATLLDGRVLVAGGYYLAGSAGSGGSPSSVTLAAYRGPEDIGTTPLDLPFHDVAPPAEVPSFASAELFDPATGSWAGTGPLKYARLAAPAVTLTDGRVLVAGSTPGGGWDYTVPRIDARAYTTAELYDPRTGRFSLTGNLPAVDWTPLAKWGPYPVESFGVASPGTLVALADGGALLVGQLTTWWISDLDMEGSTVRTLRFDAATGKWSLVDQAVTASTGSDEFTVIDVVVPGYSRPDSLAVRLADGRVLIAGGGSEGKQTDAAQLYDPGTDTWATLPPMPGPRAAGAAVLLADGSVLIVGGPGVQGQSCGEDDECSCGEGATGFATAVRFIPGP